MKKRMSILMSMAIAANMIASVPVCAADIFTDSMTTDSAITQETDDDSFSDGLGTPDPDRRYGPAYLEVKYRKLWFHLCNPNGKISKKLLSANENMAIIEARVYRDCNDPEENYIGSGFSQKFRTDDANFGLKFLESAETAAIGRALAEAGYGIQFIEGEEGDREQVDAGFPMSQAQKMGYQPSQMPQTEPGYPQNQNNYPAFDQNQSGGNYSGFTPVRNPNTSNFQGQAPMDTHQPVETILRSLTYEQAKQVEAVGTNKGKTLGQLAVENPSALQWYANTYKGPNNLLRAAALRLLQQAA